MSFVELLARLGGMGRFQVAYVAALAVPLLMLASHNLLQNFTAGVPEHHCRPRPAANATAVPLAVSIPSDGHRRPQRCRRFVEPQWHLLDGNGSDSAPANGSATEAATEPCHDGWTYLEGIFSDTIVTEWDLVCDSRRLRQVAQSIYMAGILLGSGLFGVLSDKFGRRALLTWCYLQLGATGVGTAAAPSLPIYCVCRFLTGLAMAGVSLNSASLCMEWIPTGARAVVGTINGYCYTLGQFVLAAAAFALPRWRQLQLVVSLPFFVFFFYSWLYVESARWQVTSGRPDLALRGLRKVARINGRKEEGDKLSEEVRTPGAPKSPRSPQIPPEPPNPPRTPRNPQTPHRPLGTPKSPTDPSGPPNPPPTPRNPQIPSISPQIPSVRPQIPPGSPEPSPAPPPAAILGDPPNPAPFSLRSPPDPSDLPQTPCIPLPGPFQSPQTPPIPPTPSHPPPQRSQTPPQLSDPPPQTPPAPSNSPPQPPGPLSRPLGSPPSPRIPLPISLSPSPAPRIPIPIAPSPSSPLKSPSPAPRPPPQTPPNPPNSPDPHPHRRPDPSPAPSDPSPARPGPTQTPRIPPRPLQSPQTPRIPFPISLSPSPSPPIAPRPPPARPPLSAGAAGSGAPGAAAAGGGCGRARADPRHEDRVVRGLLRLVLHQLRLLRAGHGPAGLRLQRVPEPAGVRRRGHPGQAALRARHLLPRPPPGPGRLPGTRRPLHPRQHLRAQRAAGGAHGPRRGGERLLGRVLQLRLHLLGGAPAHRHQADGDGPGGHHGPRGGHGGPPGAHGSRRDAGAAAGHLRRRAHRGGHRHLLPARDPRRRPARDRQGRREAGWTPPGRRRRRSPEQPQEQGRRLREFGTPGENLGPPGRNLGPLGQNLRPPREIWDPMGANSGPPKGNLGPLKGNLGPPGTIRDPPRPPGLFIESNKISWEFPVPVPCPSPPSSLTRINCLSRSSVTFAPIRAILAAQ